MLFDFLDFNYATKFISWDFICLHTTRCKYLQSVSEKIYLFLNNKDMIIILEDTSRLYYNKLFSKRINTHNTKDIAHTHIHTHRKPKKNFQHIKLQQKDFDLK